MSRRDFFQLFCMFCLRLINRKCAKENTEQYLMLYQNWNRTPVYFELAVSDITSTHSLNGSWLGLGLNHGSPSPHPLYNDSRQLEWSVPHMIELSRNCKLNIDETRLTFNCAHLRSTNESLTFKYFDTGWYWLVLGQYRTVRVDIW